MAAMCKLCFVLLSMALVSAALSGKVRVADPLDGPLDSGDFPVSKNIWISCDYSSTPLESCHDCNTRLICTKVGGFLIPCWWPGSNNCVEGKCSSEPSDSCARGTTTTETPEVPEPTSEATTASWNYQ